MKLYIIRGLPGSGKSTLAQQVAGSAYREADMFFMVEGKYIFDRTKLGAAHDWCRAEVRALLAASTPVVAVSNTFTKRWEMQPYLDLAAEFGAEVEVVTCRGQYGNVHGVPQAAIDAMAARWEE